MIRYLGCFYFLCIVSILLRQNGNLTKDLNKDVTGIQYNCLNLPSKVTFKDGNTITYLYAADGTKLRTVHKTGSTTTTTDYCGNVVYENGTQKYLLTEEGYVTLADSKYHYYWSSVPRELLRRRIIIIRSAGCSRQRTICSLISIMVRSSITRTA